MFGAFLTLLYVFLREGTVSSGGQLVLNKIKARLGACGLEPPSKGGLAIRQERAHGTETAYLIHRPQSHAYNDRMHFNSEGNSSYEKQARSKITNAQYWTLVFERQRIRWCCFPGP